MPAVGVTLATDLRVLAEADAVQLLHQSSLAGSRTVVGEQEKLDGDGWPGRHSWD